MNGFYVADKKDVEGAEVLKALGHPIRLALMRMLLKRGYANVKTIYTNLDLPQSTVSLHLTKLRHCNLVRGQRQGLEIYYEVSDERVKKIVEAIQ